MPGQRPLTIEVTPELIDAVLHGPLPRPLDKVARDTARAQGAPTDGPIVKDTNSISTGGASQILFAARSNRAQWFVQNPIANTENIYVRVDGGDASTADNQSIEIPPGASAGDDSDSTTQTAITIVAATAGTPFYAEETLK